MPDLDWLTLLSEPRRRITALLRQETRTVPELAALLGVTPNAVRGHLAALVAHGLAEGGSPRRDRVGKPPTVYRLTAAGEELHPRGYGGLLLAILELMAEWDGPEGPAELLRAVGARQAAQTAPASGPLERATAVLVALGAEVEEGSGPSWLSVTGCPFAAAVVEHPELCDWMAAFVAGAAAAPCASRCDRAEGHPRCRFTLTDSDSARG